MEEIPLQTTRMIWALLIVCLLFTVGAHAGDRNPTATAVDAWLADIHLPAKNYVSDGSFENGGKGWTWFVHKGGEITTDHTGGGKASFRMGTNDPNRIFYYYQYNLPLDTGRTYTFSAMVKTEGITEDRRATGAILLTDYGWTSKSIPLEAPATTGDWTHVTKTFVAPQTKARADGKPTYHLVIYWPPNNPGQIWIDDVQVEAGNKATAYSDLYVGDGIAAMDSLKTLGHTLFATTAALANFPKSNLVDELSARLGDIRGRADVIRDDLKSFASLSQTDRENLSDRITKLTGELAGIRAVTWLGQADLPLSDVNMPDAAPEALTLDMTCLRGEHRDVALNIAPLEARGYPVKLTPTTLYNEALGLDVPASQWLTIYTVPSMRGYQRKDRTFTDPLPQLNEAGIAHIEPNRINQVILSVDTTSLMPGDYRATIAVDSLVDADNRRTVDVTLKVLPEALLPIEGVNIVECFGHVDYAWQAMLDLGVNTFDVNTHSLDVAFDESGNLTRTDFARTDHYVHRVLAEVPDAQFMFFSGQDMYRRISLLTGLTPDDPGFERAFKQWTRAIVDHFAALGVSADRLIMETYDEPGPGDYVAGTQQAQWMEEVEPALKTHFYASGVVQDDAWKRNAMAHDIVGPIISNFHDSNIPFLANLNKTLWIYDCAADTETFHPIAYYRMVPWTCRQYNIMGWGHYSWFNTSHGRPYVPWQGVEAQNLVYPAPDNKTPILSRRYLAMRAGHEDYRALDALQRVARRTQGAAGVDSFIADAYNQALRLSPRVKGYQSHITSDVPSNTLDTLRAEAVDRAAAMMPESRTLDASLQDARVVVGVPEQGALRVRYLVDGALPWHEVTRDVQPGRVDVTLPDATGRVNRCIAELTGESGQIWLGAATIIPAIAVDSTSPPYSARKLNDGIYVESVKFEPNLAWISGATAGEHWVEMDLGRDRAVSEVRLHWMTYTSLPVKVGLRYLDGGGNWQPIPGEPQWRAVAEGTETISLNSLKTRKLRIVQAPLGGGVISPMLMGLSEVEVE